ncbi:MAG: histidine phosphatase family protein [Proteobacteria bacterium]|nr:histidine phosphatase family protein [Pseudomonadota bacterium]
MSDGSTRWWLVRHAPVIGVEGKIYGADDVPCDTSDEASFKSLAARLPANALWLTSHLSRAKLTAEAIRAAGLDYPTPEVIADLGEQNFGHWQGRTWDEMRDVDPTTYEAFWSDPVRNRPPGGESFADQVTRVGRVIDTYTQRHSGRDIVAVSHGGTVRAALSHVLGLVPEAGMAISVQTLSITRIEHVPGGLLRGKGNAWRVVHVNLPAKENQ